MRSLLTIVSILSLVFLPLVTLGQSRSAYKPSPFGKQYFYNASAVTFNEAEGVCSASGGTMVRLESRSEQDWVRQEIAMRNKFWLGGKANTANSSSVSSSSYKWLDGSTIVWTKWYSSQPDCTNHSCCAIWLDDDDTWMDSVCASNTKAVVCQRVEPRIDRIAINQTLTEINGRLEAAELQLNYTLDAIRSSNNDTVNLLIDGTNETSVSRDKLTKLIAGFRLDVEGTHHKYKEAKDQINQHMKLMNGSLKATEDALRTTLESKFATVEQKLTIISNGLQQAARNITSFRLESSHHVINLKTRLNRQELGNNGLNKSLSAVRKTIDDLVTNMTILAESNSEKADRNVTLRRQDDTEHKLGSFRSTMIAVVTVISIALVAVGVVLTASVIIGKRKLDLLPNYDNDDQLIDGDL